MQGARREISGVCMRGYVKVIAQYCMSNWEDLRANVRDEQCEDVGVNQVSRERNSSERICLEQEVLRLV